jgi:ribosomal protein L37E
MADPSPQQEAHPSCRACGTDNYLVYSAYTPDGAGADGHVRPAHASYTCTRCGAADEHDVPSRWRPPGWFCCS